MQSSNISKNFYRPTVIRVGRDLRSAQSCKSATTIFVSPSKNWPSTRQNQVSPEIDDLPEDKDILPKSTNQYQETLFLRRTCFLVGEAIMVFLVLGAITAIIVLSILPPTTKSIASATTSVSGLTSTNSIVSAGMSTTIGSSTNSNIFNATNISTTTTGSIASSTGNSTSITTVTSTSLTTTTTVNLSLRWNSTGKTLAGLTGVATTSANRLNQPFSLALDSSRTLYVADQQNSRVQQWSTGASVGSTVAGQSTGTFGTSSSDLQNPSGIVLDANDNMYIADTDNNRVQLWLMNASSVTTIAGITGSAGSANNELINPYGLALDSTLGTLYIVDQSNNRVMSYTSGASSGTVVAGGNGFGTSSTQLYYPVGLFFDSSSNSLIIANAGANNIVRWALGASSWTLVAGSLTGSKGNSSTLLNYPVGVTLDPMGNVYVADRDNHRIQFFLARNSTGRTIAGVTGKAGGNSTLLFSPCSVALDSDLNLYVADTYNDRIQMFIRY